MDVPVASWSWASNHFHFWWIIIIGHLYGCQNGSRSWIDGRPSGKTSKRYSFFMFFSWLKRRKLKKKTNYRWKRTSFVADVQITNAVGWIWILKKKNSRRRKFKFLNFCLNDLNKFNWHCLIAFDVLYNFAFESVAIGRSVQPQTHENRLRESERPFVYGDLRPNASSDRIKSKRFLVENQKRYRMMYLQLKFNQIWPSYFKFTILFFP